MSENSTEKLYVENFGGLKKVTIDIKSMTVLIGPQASGKSICAKLLYYFKGFFEEILSACEEEIDKRTLDKNYKNKFIEYFPKESWRKGEFSIKYFIEDEWMLIIKEENKALKFTYSKGIAEIIAKCRAIVSKERKEIEEKLSFRYQHNSRKISIDYYKLLRTTLGNQASFNQIFIPAGRSFFANLQASIFSFLREAKSLDPFLIEFGSFYENYKRSYIRSTNREDEASPSNRMKDADELISEILKGKFIREKEQDYLLHNDSRKVNLINASSGQQEILPLLIILKSLLNNRAVFMSGVTLYIEEPEAHLFPTAQTKVIDLLATLFEFRGRRFQFIITTHSPYNISALNNLMEAGRIKLKTNDKDELERLNSAIPRTRHIHPNYVSAYALKNGDKKSLYDKDSGLLLADSLDEVSDDISVKFGELLDLE